MPTVDMPVSQAGSQVKPGFGTGLPTPILLAVVGGGVGLVVFLMRRSGSNTGTGADKGTLLPNTAIMLGSLQQMLLNLQGTVTTGNADLSSQLTGVGENLGTQIDIQSGQIQQSFSDLNTYLGANFTALQSTEGSLATAIAGLGTQNAGLAESLTSVLNQLYSLNTGVANSTKLSQENQQAILGGIQAIQAGQNAIQAQVSTVGGQISDTWGPFMEITRGIHDIQNAMRLPPT